MGQYSIGADTQAIELLAQAQLPKADRVVNECRAIEGGEFVIPGSEAKHLFVKWKGRAPQDLSWQKEWNAISVLSVSLVEKPSKGALVAQGNDPIGDSGYTYVSSASEFTGTDRFSFLVKLSNGKSVLMRYQMEPGAMERSFHEQRCVFATRLGQVQLSPIELQGFVSDQSSWLRAAQLSALLANASESLAPFQDLPGTALGQTTGEGLSAQITLDTNAAGHGWYIDPTPLDNSDDYLATSDPTVWKAKADSAAAGKMDMLSVLLHEYGHALGLEHSGNGADFMAASLQPGMRKLPSAAELTLMSQLVAELKNAGGEALTLALSQGEREQDDPSSPSPLSALGLLPLGFMRRNGGSGSGNASATTGAATVTHTDYLTAINTTLANGSLHAGQNGTIDQWESVGNVAATPTAAFQAVTLGESTTAQAHLVQAFVLSAQDRFLTFTVSGLDLKTNSTEQGDVFTAAPQDAFEVALQNANTGANLLATDTSNLGNCPF